VSAPLVPAPVYGLRAWTVVGEPGHERLAGPHQGTPWPPGGDWLEASCTSTPGHRAPEPGCDCGIHAWHPTRRSARAVFSVRREVPGIAEAQGAIELHEDGFRAPRARPHALVLAPGRNAGLVRRLAAAYGTPVLELGDPGALLAWCREHGVGLEEAVVADLLGSRRGRARGARPRKVAIRLAAIVAASALLVAAGTQLASDPPGERVLNGRTGEIHVGER
jgi:hypothetical protein